MKQIVLKIIFSLFIIFLILFLLYYFIFDNKKSLNSSSLFIQFHNDDVLEVSNRLPLSNELGKKDDCGESSDFIDCINFTVKNISSEMVNYEIYITKEYNKSEIKGDYIIYYLSDDSNYLLKGYDSNILPSYKSLLSLSDKPYAKLLYSGRLSSEEKKNFILKTWVSDSYTISDNLEKFRVNVNIRVK